MSDNLLRGFSSVRFDDEYGEHAIRLSVRTDADTPTVTLCDGEGRPVPLTPGDADRVAHLLHEFAIKARAAQEEDDE